MFTFSEGSATSSVYPTPELMNSFETYLTSARQVATKAVEHDDNENFVEAKQMYETALGFLMTAAKSTEGVLEN